MNGQRAMESKENHKLRAKKGLWRPEEDTILKTYVETHGEGNWATVSAKSGLERSGKSCRLRWKNYLRPDIKRGEMSMEERDLIIRMHKLLGNRWSLIAGRLPGRTDNEVKNYWNTHLSKRHQSGKRKTTDDSEYRSRQNEPSGRVEGSESVAEQVDGEKSSTCIGDTMIWEPQSINYHFGSPTHPANTETFVFDDGPFLAYLESFLSYESTSQIEKLARNMTATGSIVPEIGCTFMGGNGCCTLERRGN